MRGHRGFAKRDETIESVHHFRALFVLLVALIAPDTSHAQEHQQLPAPPAPQEHQHHTGAPEQNLFPAREASGTSWLPDVTPMHGWHMRARGWDLMWHGVAYLQYINESAEEHRGAHQTGSINWVMAMARRPAGAGRFGVRTMLSAEPGTIGGCGYPLLLATGETCEGDTIHDRQHQHDLFMELALEYERPVRGGLRWRVYGGAAGEPALGPVAFPHRPSAMANPLAPIGHHWLDATHITFGVITTGVSSPRWNAEASVFNGREPDEDRTGLDLAALDSFSARVTVLPTPTIAIQVSSGRLNDAERHGSLPATDVTRLTASATHHRRTGASFLATTAAWGVNVEPMQTTHALLIESALSLRDAQTMFLRGEMVGKPAHDLHVHESTEVFTVGRVQLGYVRYWGKAGVQLGAGGSVSGSVVPSYLSSRYGGRVAPGVAVFLTLRPAAHSM